MDTWTHILRTFEKVLGNVVYFSRFGILYKEKSGNPGVMSHFHFLSNILFVEQSSTKESTDQPPTPPKNWKQLYSRAVQLFFQFYYYFLQFKIILQFFHY
jgi:hypothetical protein